MKSGKTGKSSLDARKVEQLRSTATVPWHRSGPQSPDEENNGPFTTARQRNGLTSSMMCYNALYSYPFTRLFADGFQIWLGALLLTPYKDV